jgi:hypothetical protein
VAIVLNIYESHRLALWIVQVSQLITKNQEPSTYSPMLSPETLESYRRMTLGERLRLTFELQEQSEKYMLVGGNDVVRRKFELLHRENDARNVNMLTAIARTKLP